MRGRSIPSDLRMVAGLVVHARLVPAMRLVREVPPRRSRTAPDGMTGRVSDERVRGESVSDESVSVCLCVRADVVPVRAHARAHRTTGVRHAAHSLCPWPCAGA